MVFLVERYLPGMSEEALRDELERLGPATAGTAVRYIGSMIIGEDESCLCQFEGPSAVAVAEVNSRAGVPLDRIVPGRPVVPHGASSSCRKEGHA